MVEIDNLKPPFCRQGNKYGLREKIIPLIPPHKTYVEVFAGSGAIFYNKAKAERNVLNDLDKDTIDKFKMIKKAPIDPDKYRQDLNSLKKIKYFFDHHGQSIEDRLLLEKIKACNGFSGVPADKASRIYKPYNPASIVKLMNEYHEKLKGTILLQQDYEKVIKKYDSPTTFFFLDPPYENTSKQFGYAEDTGFDFYRLEEVLKSIKGNFLMTINDSANIRKIFKDFNLKKVDVRNNWYNDANSTKKTRKELFISNYTMTRQK